MSTAATGPKVRLDICPQLGYEAFKLAGYRKDQKSSLLVLEGTAARGSLPTDPGVEGFF